MKTYVFTIKDPVAMSGFPIPPLAVGQGETQALAAQSALKSLGRLADLKSTPADDGQPMWANQGRLALQAALQGEDGYAWALETYEIEPCAPVDGYVNAQTEQVAVALMTHAALRRELQGRFRFLAMDEAHFFSGTQELNGAQSEAAWVELHKAIQKMVPLVVRNAAHQCAWSDARFGVRFPMPLAQQIDWVAVLEDVMEEGFPMTREQSEQMAAQVMAEARPVDIEGAQERTQPGGQQGGASTTVDAKARSIDKDVLAVLGNGRCDDKKFFLPAGQLERKLYERTDEVLKALGGKWNRSVKAHVFEDDAQTVVQSAIWSKSFVRPQDLGFFPTPDDLADRLMDQVDRQALARLGDISRLRLLEPSAGSGSLVRAAIRSFGVAPEQITCFEILPGNVKALKALGVNVIEADFLTADPDDFEPFDLVVMNPPFSNSQDVKHIEHASRFLHTEGQLAAIASPSWEFRQAHASSSKFRDLLSMVGAHVEKVPAGAFKSSGTDVATRMIRFHADCLPWAKSYQAETASQIPRYLASAGWGHIFDGNREETTRWIYDCAEERLAGAQGLSGDDWVDLNSASMRDLLESIHHNEAIESPDDFGLVKFDSLPSWQEVCDNSVSAETLEPVPSA